MPATSNYNEKELLRRMASGDTSALNAFFDLYKNRLYIFVEQLIQSKADAEEIVQDTFIKVWQSSARLSEIEMPDQYIFQIAKNKTLNYMRKIARDKKLIDRVWINQVELDDSFEARINQSEISQLINLALGQLSEQRQTIFRLSRDKGLNHKEIAELLGLSQSRIKNMLVEILKHIRFFLQQHSPFLAFLILASYSWILF